MVKYKSNTVKNSGYQSVGTATETNIYSISIPEKADEIRFQVLMTNAAKNVPMYSFNPKFEVNTWDSSQSQFDLDHWTLPMLDGGGDALMRDGGMFAYTYEIVIRTPSNFGEQIYFSCSTVGAAMETIKIQWQIIGGCTDEY